MPSLHRAARSGRRRIGLLAVLAVFLLAACTPDPAAEPCPPGVYPGALVITELMADPEGPDTGKEWFEVKNVTDADIDVRGLRIFFETAPGGRLTQRRHTIVSDEPVILPAGAYGVFSDGTETPGLIWSYGRALGSMPGTGLGVRLLCGDGVEIDAICFGAPCGIAFDIAMEADVVDGESWGDVVDSVDVGEGEVPPTPDIPAFAFPEGPSLALGRRGAAPPSADENDDIRNWRVAEPPPGAPNPWAYDCPRPAEGVIPVRLAPGMLHITEVFADPPGLDKDKEWFEFYLDAPGWVSFEGVRATTTEPAFASDPAPTGGHVWSSLYGCTVLEGGRYYVAAGTLAVDSPAALRTAEEPWPTVGGAPVIQILTKVSLANTDGRAFLWRAGRRMAGARFGTSLEGHSRERVFTPGEPARDDTDETIAWCDSFWPYRGAFDWSHRGTPGRENTACGSHFCARPDGAGGRAVTPVLPPSPDELVITEVFSNAPELEGGKDSYHEWFEAHLLPRAGGPRDLAGLRMQRRTNESSRALHDPEFLCRTAQPGDWLLFAFSDDPAENGGLPTPHGIFTLPFGGFTSERGYLALFTPDGTLLDEVVEYGRTTPGVATQVNVAILSERAPAEWNDTPERVVEDDEGEEQTVPIWCPALPSYGPHGARGTPGQPNLPCGRCYCYDEEDERWIEAVPPRPGEVRFTEIFANTPGSTCRQYQWVELTPTLSAGAGVRHLNCAAVLANEAEPEAVTVTNTRFIGHGRERCIPLAPGQAPLVLCADAAGAERSGLGPCEPGLRVELRVSAGSRVALVVPGAGAAGGNTVVDEVEYGPAVAGRALMLPGSDPSLDDADWCSVPETADYLYGEYSEFSEKRFYGTPGALNPSCAGRK